MTTKEIATWESWVEAPRWLLPSDFIFDGVVEANKVLRRKGVDELTLEYERENLTLFTRRIYFKISGSRVALTAFRQCVANVANQ